MAQYFTELTVAAATAYAQLQTAALAVELDRDVSHLHGSFSTKLVKDSKHWYFSFREPDQRIRQIYVGPDNEQVRALVENGREQAPGDQLKPLAKSALSLGCSAIVRKHLSVILRLNEFGFFRAGGVLVGTHAFLSFANQLGLGWKEPDQTADIDFAHAGRNISIGLPATIDATPHNALTTMKEGFLPLGQYRGSIGPSYRHPAEPEFQIDFLTTRTADSDEPITIDNLDVALQPLRFMEFSLEHIEQATLFDPTGRVVVVNVPAPHRFAIHKLLIVGERTTQHRAKVTKDLAQVAALVEYFAETDLELIQSTWNEVVSRGSGWRRRALHGHEALTRLAPAIAASLPLP